MNRWQLALIGPVRLYHDGAQQPLPIKRGQALLVLLALAGRQPRARVCAMLWPSLDESMSRRNLRRELARLRELGAGDLIAADGDWLALAEGVACEATMPDAVATGVAVSTLADGLELADAAPFLSWLAVERERHAQRLRATLVERAAALEVAGETAAALALVHAQLDADPLHEAMHLAAMRLLASLGQRDAALVQFERCRQLLATELGLEPMAATSAFAAGLSGGTSQSAALAQGPMAEPLPLQLPAALPFAGREAEVGQLEDWWQDSGAAGGIAWLQGEGGIGKTRLATEFAAARGAFARVACRAADRAMPFSAMARALRALGGDRPDAIAIAPWAQAALTPLLLPDRAGNDAAVAGDPARLQGALTLAWRALAGDRENFDAVIVDDFHLADDASQRLLGQIAVNAPSSRLMVLLRGSELGDAGREALAMSGDGRPGSLVLALHPLPEAAVLALVRQLSGARDPTRFARRLERATAGNPFFLSETLRHLAETGLLRAGASGVWQTAYDDDTQDYAELPVPASVESAVQARARRLPEATRRLLEAASLAAEPFSPSLLAGACALSEMEALRGLEPALDARLLRDVEQGGYAFEHDLVAQSLRRTLTAPRRRLLHRQIAVAAEQGGAEPALIAEHLEAAGDAPRAVAFRIAAAERAGRLHSMQHGRQHWEQALADQPTVAQRIHILGRVAMIWRQLGLGPQVAVAIRELDSLREACDDPDAAIEASVRAAYLCYQSGRGEEALRRAEAALAAGIRDARLRMIAVEARCAAFSAMGRVDEAERAIEAGLADPELAHSEHIRLLGVLTKLHYVTGRKALALQVCERQLAVILAIGDRRFQAMALGRIGIISGDLGLRARATVALEQSIALCVELQLLEQHREALRGLADFACADGDGERALALTQRGWGLAATFSGPENRALYRMLFHRAQALCGALGAALTAGAQARADVVDLSDADPRENALASTVDAITLLGCYGQASALLAQAPQRPPGPLRQLGPYAIRVVLSRTLLALREGRIDDAGAALAAIADADVDSDFEGRALCGLRRAQWRLARGDAKQALASLLAQPQPLPAVEQQAAWQTTRLHALVALGRPDPTALNEASEALASGRLPALDGLDLRHAIWRSRIARGDVPGAAADHAALVDAQRRLAASLEGHEEARRCFDAHWRSLGVG